MSDLQYEPMAIKLLNDFSDFAIRNPNLFGRLSCVLQDGRKIRIEIEWRKPEQGYHDLEQDEGSPGDE